MAAMSPTTARPIRDGQMPATGTADGTAARCCLRRPPSVDQPSTPPMKVAASSAKNAAPARIGVGKKVADIAFAQSAQDGIANGVHQHIGVGMPFQSLWMRDFDATEDEFMIFDQCMYVVANANMNHGEKYRRLDDGDQGFP